MYSLRHAASLLRERSDSSMPSIFKLPPVGRSMPAIRLSSVVLPLPLGPINARNVPASTSRSRLSSGLMIDSPRRYSRVRLRHSMSGIVSPFRVVRRGAGGRVRFADDADLRTRVEMRRVAGDELITRLKTGCDRDPAVLS